MSISGLSSNLSSAFSSICYWGTRENLRNRTDILCLMKKIPSAQVTETDVILHFIEFHSVMGRGIGQVDVCFFASARLTNAQFWSLDKRLQQSASLLALNHEI